MEKNIGKDLKKDKIKHENSDCCKAAIPEKKGSGILSGILYGLLPHSFCVAFILLTVLGVTAATALLKPLLLNRYFFYILIALAFAFAAVSAILYLRRLGMLSREGIKKKRNYLLVMFGTTIAVNLLFFLVISPVLANITMPKAESARAAELTQLTLAVDIPCSGHSPLISEELKSIEGVESIKFRFPNYFDIGYDPEMTSEEKILALEVFKSYPAKVDYGFISS